ncbi:hypothetical protein KY358_04140 [Candidatus Woesearchaeota archaeon]|nr:hypothetical protein [Candidatus Woesearchaeota archaeon]
MRKTAILGILIVCLLASAIGKAANDLEIAVDVSDMLPSVLEIAIRPDDRPDPGIQVNKTGDAVPIIINATVSDLNGLDQIAEVNAVVKGPSVIEESPISLLNIISLSESEGKYNGSFILDDGDMPGNYTINVTVSDSTSIGWSNITIEYMGDQKVMVYFNRPENNSRIPGEEYLLNASANMEMQRANFSAAWAYLVESEWRCFPDEVFETLCENNDPGYEFTCLTDFSQDFLVAMDDWLCLKAELFGAEDINGTAYAVVNVDNIAPADITDLSTHTEIASATEERIVLTWTAPGDNDMNDRADRYVIKTSTSPIETEQDFNDADDIGGTCALKTPSLNGTAESCHAGSFTIGDPTVHYFKIKTFDDVDQSSLSNLVEETTTQFYSVSVDFINYSTEGKTEHTNYLYDNVTVWGNLTNDWGNTAEVTATFRVSSEVMETKSLTLDPYETKKVEFNWSVNDPYSTHNPTISLIVSGLGQKSTENVKEKNLKVYSIKNDADLRFRYDTKWPIPKNLGSETNNPFYTCVDIYNLAGLQPDNNFYNLSIHLDSDGAILSGTQDVCGIGIYSDCTPDSFGNSIVTYHPLAGYDNIANWCWFFDSGTSGSEYNVSVYMGNPGDRITISRLVHIG